MNCVKKKVLYLHAASFRIENICTIAVIFRLVYYTLKQAKNKHCRNTVKQNNGSITPYISFKYPLMESTQEALLGKDWEH